MEVSESLVFSSGLGVTSLIYSPDADSIRETLQLGEVPLF